MEIKLADFSDPQVLALLQFHLDGMYATSPPENVFALDLSGLQQHNVLLYTGWIEEGTTLAVIGALKMHDSGIAEIKSMRTHPDYLGKGLAAELLRFLLEQAKARNAVQISLETGSGKAFDAAIGLYKKHGFIKGDAFAEYQPSEFSQFFHLTLNPQDKDVL